MLKQTNSCQRLFSTLKSLQAPKRPVYGDSPTILHHIFRKFILLNIPLKGGHWSRFKGGHLGVIFWLNQIQPKSKTGGQYAPESVFLLISQIAQRGQHVPESNVLTLQNAKRSISSIHIFFEISQERGSTCSGICLLFIEILSGGSPYAGMAEC